MTLDRFGEQCGDFSAGAGGLVEVGGQFGPVRVGCDVGLDAVSEAAPALRAVSYRTSNLQRFIHDDMQRKLFCVGLAR